MSNHSVTFINESPLPISVETWQQTPNGLSEMKCEIVKPRESIFMRSETGEWEITTYLYDETMCSQWTKAGYKLCQTIGKFRNKPCIKGEYSWMYCNDFTVVYSNEVATFSKKIVKIKV